MLLHYFFVETTIESKSIWRSVSNSSEDTLLHELNCRTDKETRSRNGGNKIEDAEVCNGSGQMK